MNARDDRLGQIAHGDDGRVGVLAQRCGHVQLADIAPVGNLQVGAGAEGIARAREDDDAAVVFGGALNGFVQQAEGFRVNGVAALRPIDGDALDAVFERHL